MNLPLPGCAEPDMSDARPAVFAGYFYYGLNAQGRAYR